MADSGTLVSTSEESIETQFNRYYIIEFLNTISLLAISIAGKNFMKKFAFELSNSNIFFTNWTTLETSIFLIITFMIFRKFGKNFKINAEINSYEIYALYTGFYLLFGFLVLLAYFYNNYFLYLLSEVMSSVILGNINIVQSRKIIEKYQIEKDKVKINTTYIVCLVILFLTAGLIIKEKNNTLSLLSFWGIVVGFFLLLVKNKKGRIGTDLVKLDTCFVAIIALKISYALHEYLFSRGLTLSNCFSFSTILAIQILIFSDFIWNSDRTVENKNNSKSQGYFQKHSLVFAGFTFLFSFVVSFMFRNSLININCLN